MLALEPFTSHQQPWCLPGSSAVFCSSSVSLHPAFLFRFFFFSFLPPFLFFSSNGKTPVRLTVAATAVFFSSPFAGNWVLLGPSVKDTRGGPRRTVGEMGIGWVGRACVCVCGVWGCNVDLRQSVGFGCKRAHLRLHAELKWSDGKINTRRYI